MKSITMNLFLRRCFLFLALAGGTWAASAQTLRELTRLDADLPPNAEAYAFSNERGALLLFQEGSQAQLLLLNPQLEVVRNFTVTDLPAPADFDRLGFTFQGGQLSICYRERGTGLLQVIQVNPEAGETEVFRLQDQLAGDLNWGTFTHEGILHMVRVPRFGNEIRLCRFEGGGEFNAFAYPVPQGFTEQLAGGVQRLDSSNRAQLSTTYWPAKMYLYDGQLYLTREDSGYTEVMHIDLATREAQFHEHHLPDGTRLSNSLLLDDRLFQLGMSADSLFFGVSQVGDSLPLSQYRYHRAGLWRLREGPVVQRDPTGNQYLDLSSAEVSAAWDDAPHLALALTAQEEDRYLLACGAVWPQRERGLSGAVIHEQTRSLAFQSFLDIYSLQPVGPPAELIATNRFPPEYFQRAPLSLSFQLQQQRYWGYYDRQTGKFVLSVEER